MGACLRAMSQTETQSACRHFAVERQLLGHLRTEPQQNQFTDRDVSGSARAFRDPKVLSLRSNQHRRKLGTVAELYCSKERGRKRERERERDVLRLPHWEEKLLLDAVNSSCSVPSIFMRCF